MAPHSRILAWKIPWTEEPGRLLSMGSLRVRHDWATSLSLFTFTNWRRKWQPTPVFLPGESQGRESLVGCRLWGRTESDTTERLSSSSSSIEHVSRLFLQFVSTEHKCNVITLLLSQIKCLLIMIHGHVLSISWTLSLATSQTQDFCSRYTSLHSPPTLFLSCILSWLITSYLLMHAGIWIIFILSIFWTSAPNITQYILSHPFLKWLRIPSLCSPLIALGLTDSFIFSLDYESWFLLLGFFTILIHLKQLALSFQVQIQSCHTHD